MGKGISCAWKMTTIRNLLECESLNYTIFFPIIVYYLFNRGEKKNHCHCGRRCHPYARQCRWQIWWSIHKYCSESVCRSLLRSWRCCYSNLGSSIGITSFMPSEYPLLYATSLTSGSHSLTQYANDGANEQTSRRGYGRKKIRIRILGLPDDDDACHSSFL